MDKSNAYEEVAKTFIEIRGKKLHGIGVSHVRKWIRSLPTNSTVLDLGYGTGIPITKVLVEEEMNVHGIDASATLIKEFQKNFSNIPVECEAVENSRFFNKQFDAIIAWGLIFLLSTDIQIKLLQKIAGSLKSGGRLFFTAPKQKTEWEDLLSKKKLRSLGAKKYRKVLLENDLSLIQEFNDEGENYYFEAIKN